MRLADDAETARWLESLAAPEALEWDRGNRTKSEVKHGFSVADVESILASPVLLAGCIVEPASSEKRYLLLGVTADGRYAALVFTRRGEKLRPISCRAMRRKEKERYDAAS
jgi:uncharacterized DUF497 family protein